jgi:hypothetical protein
MTRRIGIAKVAACVLAIYVFGPLLVVGLPSLTVGFPSSVSEEIAATGNEAKLRLHVGHAMPNRPFRVTLFAPRELGGQLAILELEPGLSFVPGESPVKRLPQPGKNRYSYVSWRVVADGDGEFRLYAQIHGQVRVSEEVHVYIGGLCNFDG